MYAIRQAIDRHVYFFNVCTKLKMCYDLFCINMIILIKTKRFTERRHLKHFQCILKDRTY